MKKTIASIILAGTWITISEFVRNELLLKEYWVRHYNSIGLQFETLPLNGILWMVWSYALAYVMYRLLQKFTLRETLVLAWLSAFFMMWITVYNLQTLPLDLLLFAIPLSVLEVLFAVVIIKKVSKYL